MSFLEEKPPWSKGRIKKLGEAIRTEDEYDKALFNDFMRQQTRLITEIEPIIQEVFSASILTEAEDDEEVSPNSGRYRYSSRVKIFAPGNMRVIERCIFMLTSPQGKRKFSFEQLSRRSGQTSMRWLQRSLGDKSGISNGT